MPDYGKLIFQALETNDLSSILRGSSSSSAEEPAPPTLISEASFLLIERLVTFSGARRPSARQALSEPPSSSSQLMGENGEPKDDAVLRDCILDVQQVLDELQRLKEREADSSDHDSEGGGGLFMFGGEGGGRDYGADVARGQSVDFEEESDDDDGQRSIRSDDFSRYDFLSGAAAAAISHNDGEERSRQFGRVFAGYDGHGPEYRSSVSVSDHGEAKDEATAREVGGEEDNGPVRAVKRYRGVSEGGNSVDGK